MKSNCTGNLADHCCYLPNGGPNGTCKYLEVDIPGLNPPRKFSCGLFNEYRASSPGGWSDAKVWSAVQDDVRYQTDVLPIMIDLGNRKVSGIVTLCRDWPPVGETCPVCGITG